MTRSDLPDLVVEALKNHGGQGSIPQICEYIWDKYEQDLRASGDLFYTWQYEMRWAGQSLQKEGLLDKGGRGSSAGWRLTS